MMNLVDPTQVATAYADIRKAAAEKAPEAHISGVLVQKFLPVGKEFIVGGFRDPSFGPLVMAGMGGIYTELLKDTAFRIAPATERDAYEMLRELRAWKLLLGMRGEAQLDIASLARIVLQVGRMLIECPGISELDLNPVLLSQDGGIIVDAKVVIG